jgi:hypothetical protein
VKNKKLTYILLPLVILIWGTIIWKFITGVSNSGINEFKSKPIPVTESVKEAPDTIQLTFQYNDPFLHSYSESVVSPQPENVVENPIKSPNIVIAWPRVEYRGAIGKHKQGNYLGMIKFADKEGLVKENELIDNARVLCIAPDSIELEYMGDKRFFKRLGL